MRRSIGLLLCLLTTPASAQRMPVAQFIAKADALKSKGPLALLSSDLGVLKAEIGNSTKELAAEQNTSTKQGRKPTFCPPGHKVALGSTELISYLRALPAAKANMSIKDGLADFLRHKYPC